MDYVRLSTNLYIHHVRLSRNLYVHYVRLSTSILLFTKHAYLNQYKKIFKIKLIICGIHERDFPPCEHWIPGFERKDYFNLASVSRCKTEMFCLCSRGIAHFYKITKTYGLLICICIKWLVLNWQAKLKCVFQSYFRINCKLLRWAIPIKFAVFVQC